MVRVDSAGLASHAAPVTEIELANVSKRYGAVSVLKELSLTVQRGEFVALRGPSGSGKTSLLALVGLLDSATSGEYRFRGQPVDELDDLHLSSLRNEVFGFVFQQFSLIPELEAWRNVARPLTYAGVPRRERKARAMELLEGLGLADCADRRPAQLSGGQQQRVAIARALVNDPDVILADEPTGNLPRSQWEPIFDTLSRLHESGKTIVVATHNPDAAGRATRSVHLSHGKLDPAQLDPAQGVSVAGTRSQMPWRRDLSAEPVLRVRFLGDTDVRLGSQPLGIKPRQADLLALLVANPRGLTGEELLLLAYGEHGNMSTLKGALSRLRTSVPVESQPYRLGLPVDADFLRVEALLKEGKVRSALELYQGPLLPMSTIPGVEELRTNIDRALRKSVMATGDPANLISLAERLKDDLELWEHAVIRLPPEDPLHAIAVANVERIREDWD